ncbi:MAG: hypothetical protein ACK2TZ_03025, partial [Anaerolineales bacterium]
MKTNRLIFGIAIVIIVAAFMAAIYLFLPGLTSPSSDGSESNPDLGFGSEAVQGEILEILEEG